MQLIYTADETFSGNPLHESGRKAWCVNFSIKEIPFAFRSQSAFWCCPAVCRTKQLEKIEGGASRLMRILLECHLYHPTRGLKPAVLAITHNGSTILLFVTFSAFFGDGDSLKLVLEIKGVVATGRALNA